MGNLSCQSSKLFYFRKHGFGKITYLNGDIFEGYFEDGRINGQGVFISKDTCKKGIWKNDLLVGE